MKTSTVADACLYCGGHAGLQPQKVLPALSRQIPKGAVTADIVLDPGHRGTQNIGGSDANHASGPSGLLEKTATLDIARRLRGTLGKAGHAVTMTRDGNTNLSLAARARAARRIKAPVFVSVHFNGFNHKAQGTETFCHTNHSARSTALCRAVQADAVKATGLPDRNAGAPGGEKTMALGVLNVRMR